MRYAALNQGADDLASFDGFVPDGVPDFKTLPAPDELNPFRTQPDRYSDEQLYALALYVYSLQPPPNPNKFDAVAAQGERIFQREGCATCHTPPLYTNNKLTPAEGFTSPPGAEQRYDILLISVGTDPNLALKTRRGTGYYKVRRLVRPTPQARRLRSDGVQALRNEDLGGEGSRLRIRSFHPRQEGADRILEDALRATAIEVSATGQARCCLVTLPVAAPATG